MAPGDLVSPSEAPGQEELDARLDAGLRESERLCSEKRYEEALALLGDLSDQFPDSPLPHHDLSVTHLMRLRDDYEHLEVWEDLADDEVHFEAAVAEAEVAVSLDGGFVPAYNNLGTLFALRGWWEDAIRHWETSLTIQPDQPEVREQLALARKRLGE